MTNNEPLIDLSGYLRKYWNQLAQAATWITAVVGMCLIRPPGLSLDDDRKIVPFTGFIVAVLLGLVVVLLYRWRKRYYTWRWWSAGAILLALSINGFFIYDNYLGKWTERCSSGQVVIGTSWTQVGNKARKDIQSTEELLSDFGCQAEILWDKDELNKRRRILAAIYVSCVAVSALTIVTIIQAIHCLRNSSRRANLKATEQATAEATENRK